MLRILNRGDKQADLTVHGGPDKAVYAYPIEHYEFWRKVFPDMELPYGMFGENFTIEGDAFEIGYSKIIATQPRMPCYKLGVKFRRMDVMYASDREDIKTMRRAVRVEALPEGWKHYFLERLSKRNKMDPSCNL